MSNPQKTVFTGLILVLALQFKFATKLVKVWQLAFNPVNTVAPTDKSKTSAIQPNNHPNIQAGNQQNSGFL